MHIAKMEHYCNTFFVGKFRQCFINIAVTIQAGEILDPVNPPFFPFHPFHHHSLYLTSPFLPPFSPFIPSITSHHTKPPIFIPLFPLSSPLSPFTITNIPFPSPLFPFHHLHHHEFTIPKVCREGFLFLPCNNQPSPRVPKYIKRITIKF